MNTEQSIIALSTPPGKGAIALLRLSGDNAIAIADRLSKLSGNKKLFDQASHTINYGWIINSAGETIDQVLFLIMKGPHTFTGQNTVEITCHNNPFIIESIIQQAIKQGARQAQPGEFTRRAFENNKLDLIQAEAINELLCAQTETALKKSLAQLKGSLSHWIKQIERELLKSLAWSEASFEFLDDEGDFGQQIKQQLQNVLETIAQVKKTFDVQQQIREGFRIALIGSVNAGKSSLFNHLLQQERSIVTDIAGTTRDSVEAGLYRNGNHWTLIDTAGLRKTKNIVEKAGIKRSFDEAHKADIIILTIDSSRALSSEENALYQELFDQYEHKIILVFTKTDILDPNSPLPSFGITPSASLEIAGDYNSPTQNTYKNSSSPPTSSSHETYKNLNSPLTSSARKASVSRSQSEIAPIKISSITGANCDLLEKTIEKRIAHLLAQSDAPFLVNKRQFNLLLHIEQKLETIATLLVGDIQYEIVSHHLREALEEVSQLTGKSINEAAMDMVFKEFCVGK